MAIVDIESSEMQIKQRKLGHILLGLIRARLMGYATGGTKVESLARNHKSLVVYFNMKGDHLLALAKAEKGETKSEAIQQSICAYSCAISLAHIFLGNCSLVRSDLGPFFNSVFSAGLEGSCWTELDDVKLEADFNKQTLNSSGTYLSNDIAFRLIPSFKRWSAILRGDDE